MIREDKKVRFAVVGSGHIGKRHAEMVSRDDESELIAMVDIRSAKECEAEKFNVPFFNSIDELLSNKEINFDSRMRNETRYETYSMDYEPCTEP